MIDDLFSTQQGGAVCMLQPRDVLDPIMKMRECRAMPNVMSVALPKRAFSGRVSSFAWLMPVAPKRHLHGASGR